MSTFKVIISPSIGSFEPNRAFAKILKTSGHTDWSSIEARTDKSVIEFVEKQISNSKIDFPMGFLGTAKDQYVMIIEVQTEKPWAISEQKGSESIRYFSYEIIDPALNFCRESI